MTDSSVSSSSLSKDSRVLSLQIEDACQSQLSTLKRVWQRKVDRAASKIVATAKKAASRASSTSSQHITTNDRDASLTVSSSYTNGVLSAAARVPRSVTRLVPSSKPAALARKTSVRRASIPTASRSPSLRPQAGWRTPDSGIGMLSPPPSPLMLGVKRAAIQVPEDEPPRKVRICESTNTPRIDTTVSGDSKKHEESVEVANAKSSPSPTTTDKKTTVALETKVQVEVVGTIASSSASCPSPFDIDAAQELDPTPYYAGSIEWRADVNKLCRRLKDLSLGAKTSDKEKPCRPTAITSIFDMKPAGQRSTSACLDIESNVKVAGPIAQAAAPVAASLPTMVSMTDELSSPATIAAAVETLIKYTLMPQKLPSKHLAPLH